MAQYQPLSRDSRTGELCIEGVRLAELAARFGTPAYCYSKQYIVEAFSAYEQGLSGSGVSGLVCVSVKANGNLTLLSLLGRRGAGFDVVSGGELYRVVRATGDSSKVVFSGVGKNDQEIVTALRQGILMFNVESVAELARINSVSAQLGIRAPVAIRVNPDIDAKTHPYISTGLEEHKFGVPLGQALELYRCATEYPQLDFVGVDCHVGSMITDLSCFTEAFRKIRGFVEAVRECSPELKFIDVGGGLAVSYGGRDSVEELAPESYSIESYCNILRRELGGLGLTIVVEPGRSIFANSSVLLTKVLYLKPTSKKQFVVVDAGFNDLIRPALYEAYHGIELVNAQVAGASGKEGPVDVVGPVCESGDCFAHDRILPEVRADDLLVLKSAGAYGFTMASNYNTRPRPVELLVDGADVMVIRPRETVEQLLAGELEVFRG